MEKYKRHCSRCGKPFVTKSIDNKHCKECIDFFTREATQKRLDSLICTIQENPCGGCGKKTGCPSGCVVWEAWFRKKWREIRKAAGVE
nr:MAG TPA: C2H2 type zinc-finger protein [Bacteriophage sp.]